MAVDCCGGRDSPPNGATLASRVCLLFYLLVFSGARMSGASRVGVVGGFSNDDQQRVIPSNRLLQQQQQQREGRVSTSRVQSDAITRLSKVFGIDRVPIHRHHRSPPQYMVELYNTVAYHNGITRIPGPYGSDVVRGFPDRANTEQMHFVFNVSYIDQAEKILQGEFRVFRLRPRPPNPSTSIPRGIHLIEVRLYQVLDPRRMHQQDGVKLLDFRRLNTMSHGWEVFKVKDAIQDWVNDTATNFGFLLEATTRRGHWPVNGSYFRVAQRAEHHDSKQPVLVVFTEDKRKQLFVDDSDSDIVQGEAIERKPVLSIHHKTYVQFLNERHRAKHGNYRSTPKRHQYSPGPSSDVTDSQPRHRGKRSVEFNTSPRKRKETCSRRELYVDFDKIGWSGWIISPKGYNAYHCKGECPFPLGQNQKPTNHATVQSIVHALSIGKEVGTPCCVPNKLYSFSLLYFDDDENVILKRYDDMVAASCGCH